MLKIFTDGSTLNRIVGKSSFSLQHLSGSCIKQIGHGGEDILCEDVHIFFEKQPALKKQSSNNVISRPIDKCQENLNDIVERYSDSVVFRLATLSSVVTYMLPSMLIRELVRNRFMVRNSKISLYLLL